jgi:hypothetical protein
MSHANGCPKCRVSEVFWNPGLAICAVKTMDNLTVNQRRTELPTVKLKENRAPTVK